MMITVAISALRPIGIMTGPPDNSTDSIKTSKENAVAKNDMQRHQGPFESAYKARRAESMNSRALHRSFRERESDKS